MTDTPEIRRFAAIAAYDAGQIAEAYRLMLPLAVAGDAEAQGFVGSLMMCSIHHYETLEQLQSGTGPIIDEMTRAADEEQAGRFLEAASAAGIGFASFNLATLYVGGPNRGYGGGSWEERKARAAELYALAYAQGFTAFGWLMNGNGAGQPYLDVIEQQVIKGEKSPPPDWWVAADNDPSCDSGETDSQNAAESQK